MVAGTIMVDIIAVGTTIIMDTDTEAVTTITMDIVTITGDDTEL
jgi:acyl-ACP thioesterase